MGQLDAERTFPEHGFRTLPVNLNSLRRRWPRAKGGPLPVIIPPFRLPSWLIGRCVSTHSLPFKALLCGDSLPDSYLVDPASSHRLVSKIKPCMSKYKQFIQ